MQILELLLLHRIIIITENKSQIIYKIARIAFLLYTSDNTNCLCNIKIIIKDKINIDILITIFNI